MKWHSGKFLPIYRSHPVQFMKWYVVAQLAYIMRRGFTTGNTMHC